MLEEIARQHPQLREQAVAILSDLLRDAEHYHEAACTGAMDALIELDAVEALPLIWRAFELGKIDQMSRGTWGDVLNDFGIEPDDDDPLLDESQRRFEERREQFLPSEKRAEILEALDAFRQLNSSATPSAFNRFRDLPADPLRTQPAARAQHSTQSQTYTRAQPKIGRNEPCPCGSGRKYKHCHGK